MPIDPNIPLQAQSGNPFQSMGQMLQPLSSLAQLQNTQQQNQMMQAETQNLQQSAQLNTQLQGERTAFSQAMQDPNAPFKNPDGTIDYGKMQQWTATHTPLVGSEYGSQIMQLAQHVNTYKTTLSSMADSDMQRTNAVLHSFMGPNGQPIADPQTMAGQLSALKRTLSGPGANYVDMAIQGINKTGDNPQALQQVLGQLARDTTPATTQTSQMQGATGMLNNGAQNVPYTTNGEYGQAPGTVTGTPGIPNQISPESAASRVPTFQNGQPGSVSLGSITPGAPGYNGGSPFGNGRMNSQPGANPSFVGNQAPMGTSEDVNWMKKDYQDVTSTASTAQQRIGLYNNVQQLSKQALTGPQDRLAYANSVLALVGVPAAQNLNDATAMLNKNAAMIQQAFGGNTDAARAVVAHMTPGSVMPDKANQEISEYGKANAQMQLFQQNYLKDASNGQNPGTYKDRKSDLSMVSDPRLWQFQNATPAKRIEMLSDMQKAGQNVQQFGALYKRANAMGAFQ